MSWLFAHATFIFFYLLFKLLLFIRVQQEFSQPFAAIHILYNIYTRFYSDFTSALYGVIVSITISYVDSTLPIQIACFNYSTSTNVLRCLSINITWTSSPIFSNSLPAQLWLFHTCIFTLYLTCPELVFIHVGNKPYLLFWSFIYHW